VDTFFPHSRQGFKAMGQAAVYCNRLPTLFTEQPQRWYIQRRVEPGRSARYQMGGTHAAGVA